MSALTVAEVLDGAADLLEKPGAWTQGEYAKTSDGTPLADGRNEKAACWCMIGSLEKVSGYLVGDGLSHPILKAIGTGMGLSEWNDAPGRTQAEVVTKLREAAALAREEQA